MILIDHNVNIHINYILRLLQSEQIVAENTDIWYTTCTTNPGCQTLNVEIKLIYGDGKQGSVINCRPEFI
jgi:hypothetical protein